MIAIVCEIGFYLLERFINDMHILGIKVRTYIYFA